MIRVQVQRTPSGAIAAFRVHGHAGYEDPGRDIVCAGVTALVETALLGLRKVARVPFRSRRHQQEGLIECTLAPGTAAGGELAQAILETMVLGLKDMAKDYQDYILIAEGG